MSCACEQSRTQTAKSASRVGRKQIANQASDEHEHESAYKMKYRPEIDGLRALAVLPVIFYHAGVETMAGGFVGVDVFFVISGFLITTIIASELNSQQFSVVSFYERRARRILPALIVVLAITSILAVSIMLPFELVNYGKGLVGAVLFVSNIVLWKQAGYFAAEAEMNPLLHTWSLGVEEQYYLFFPLLLMVIWRFRRQWALPLLLLATLGSLGLAEWASTRMPSANFYLLPTRIWELMIGAMLSLWLMRRAQPQGLAAQLISLLGLVMIIVGIFAYNDQTPFPSFYALVPVLGAAAIILAATPATLVGKWLASKPLVIVGLISYSAYLWHQPLMAFARILAPDNHPDKVVMLMLALSSLVLAWLTWKFVEQPFRNKQRFGRNWIFTASLAGSALAVLLGVGLVASKGLLSQYPEKEWPIVEKTNVKFGEYVVAAHSMILARPIEEDKPVLVIVGDSFSQDFYNMISENNAFAHYQHVALFVPARCQLFYGKPYVEIEHHIAEGDRAMCAHRILSSQQVETIRKADVVVFASKWQSWSAAIMGESLAAMAIPEHIQVMVLGTKQFEKNRRVLLSEFRRADIPSIRRMDADILEINRTLKQSVKGYGFIDIAASFCSNGCPLFTTDGSPISYDGAHLTEAGARVIGNYLFTHPPLQQYGSASDAAMAAHSN